jgi:uncharacterized protein
MKIQQRKPYRHLEAFLKRRDRPADSPSYPELQGLLFTVVCAPQSIPPADWLPFVLGDEDPDFADEDQAKRVLGDLMALYNELNEAAIKRLPAPLRSCEFREPVLANLEDDAPIAQWSRGFLTGQLWLKDAWADFGDDDSEFDAELGSCEMVLSFFSSQKLAEAFRKEADKPNGSLGEFATRMRNVFVDATASYAHLGRTIYEFTLEQEASPGPAAPSPKVGRNEPCPCGSAKKYKRCHGQGTAGDDSGDGAGDFMVDPGRGRWLH